MNATAIKNTAKKGAIKTVALTGAIIHASLTASSGIFHEFGDAIMISAEQVARGEGYIINKLDSSQSPAEIADHRKASTSMAMFNAYQKILSVKEMAKSISKPKKKRNIMIVPKENSDKFYVIVDGKHACAMHEDKEFKIIFKSEDDALLFATQIE